MNLIIIYTYIYIMDDAIPQELFSDVKPELLDDFKRVFVLMSLYNSSSNDSEKERYSNEIEEIIRKPGILDQYLTNGLSILMYAISLHNVDLVRLISKYVNSSERNNASIFAATELSLARMQRDNSKADALYDIKEILKPGTSSLVSSRSLSSSYSTRYPNPTEPYRGGKKRKRGGKKTKRSGKKTKRSGKKTKRRSRK